MHRLGRALITGLLLAIAGIYLFSTPYGRKIEEEYGLGLLFKMRGPRPHPGQAVIVNVDRGFSGTAGIPGDFSQWPRSVHAALVEKLAQYGAAVIVFDIYFSDNQDRSHDRALAEAIRRAGNVILVEELRHASPLAVGGNPLLTGGVEIEMLVPPVEPLAGAALALAPFPLPKIPVRVGQAWRFKESCGDIPTLPVAVFQAATLSRYDQLFNLLRRKAPTGVKDLPTSANEAIATLGLVETMREIRGIFLRNDWLRHDLLAEIEGAEGSKDYSGPDKDLVALINMYGGDSSAFIDFYGPPLTLETLSYGDILSSREDPAGPLQEKIRGKVVFVGAAASNWSNQKDGFYTVFSRADGLDLSGVELAATVYGNIAENRAIQPLSNSRSFGLLSGFAVFLCLISFLLPPLFAVILLASSITVYLFSAFTVFALNGTWIPLIIPLAVLPFTSFLLATLTNYLATRRERRNIHEALGFYLPGNVVDELSRDLSFIETGDRKVYGVCVITDAQHYTRLSECLTPEELSSHMKEYYQYLFREVKKQEGLVCNVIGDSMLALWPSVDQEVIRNEKACQASLQIAKAVERFNSKHREKSLPTRIGIHAGYLLLDNIGAEDHYEYAPIGDIVNTASRIEGLNKYLGTQILASEEALCGVAGVYYREIGVFLLGGKTRPVNIYELLMAKHYSVGWNRLHQKAFPEALSLFRAGEWEKALVLFNHCLTLQAGDGPSLFYKQLCERYLLTPPSADQQAVIRVGK